MIHPSLTIARKALRSTQPHFGTIADQFKYKKITDYPTMATDNTYMYYNSDYLDTLTDDEVLYALIHVTLLAIFNYIERRGDRRPYEWNVACSSVVNAILSIEKIGKMPDGAIFFKDCIDMTSDEIYELIMVKDKRVKIEYLEHV